MIMSDWYIDTHIDIARVYRKKRINTHRCFIMSMMYTRNLVGLHLKYYTDLHDVDEELRTISVHGGYWNEGEFVGVTRRHMYDNPITLGFFVASSNMKNSLIIRIIMMSTKAWWLVRCMVDIGSITPLQVSRIEIWVVLLPMYPLMLLPNTIIRTLLSLRE